MKIQEACERLKELLKEYEKKKDQLKEEYTSVQLKPRLQKLCEKYGVEEGDEPVIRGRAQITEIVIVKDVIEVEKEFDSFFGGKLIKKGLKVLATTMNGENIWFTAGCRSGAKKLNKGDQLIISGVFCLKAEDSRGYEGYGEGIHVSYEENQMFSIGFEKRREQ